MEARSDTVVQIVRHTWAMSTKAEGASQSSPKILVISRRLSSSFFLAFESSLISSAFSLEVVECIGMEPLRRSFRVCAESVTEKPKHMHLRGSVKLISAIMIARIVSLCFAIPRRISLYVPARLMGKSIAQVSTKFFLLLGMHATGCCLLMALACSLQQLCGCEKCPPSTWAPECAVCIRSTNRRGTIANPCVCVCACANYISEPDH